MNFRNSFLGVKITDGQAVAKIFTVASACLFRKAFLTTSVAVCRCVITWNKLDDNTVRDGGTTQLLMACPALPSCLDLAGQLLDVYFKFVRSTPSRFAPATRGRKVMCRSSRNDGYECYGRTDNTFISILKTRIPTNQIKL